MADFERSRVKTEHLLFKHISSKNVHSKTVLNPPLSSAVEGEPGRSYVGWQDNIQFRRARPLCVHFIQSPSDEVNLLTRRFYIKLLQIEYNLNEGKRINSRYV